jgi:hypothetical protein
MENLNIDIILYLSSLISNIKDLINFISSSKRFWKEIIKNQNEIFWK